MAKAFRSAVIEAARPAVPRPNHERCRICGSRLPAPFLDFGPMPLANAFLRSLDEAAAEPRYPLAVAGCESCGLVQLNHVVPAEQLYSNYIYVSSTSEAVRTHAQWLAAELPRRYGWGRSSLLVEVASNDGTVLKAFQAAGIPVLGVEPAANIAALAEQEGVPTAVKFFNAATAKELSQRYGKAAGILGRHVFAHVDDVHDFLTGVDTLLGPDGVLLIEVPYAGDLFRNREFDTIYHEHLSYFTLEPVDRLCRDHGFRLADVDRVALHGGSVLLHLRREGRAEPSGRLARMLEDERTARLTEPETLRAFAASVAAWRERFLDRIETLARGGSRLIGYGAAAKANTLLNYCPAAAERLEAILDRSPHKQGRFTPGTHLEVKPVERWTESPATHMLILAWNFADEIVRQMRPFAERGGRFVVPIPEPKVLE
jgi:novobiocin biosynthesis protein NovU/D-mycarose 3-C-methyltransferase